MFSASSTSSTHRIVLKSASPVAATACLWWMRKEQAVVSTRASAAAFSHHQHRWMTTTRTPSPLMTTTTTTTTSPFSSLWRRSNNNSNNHNKWWQTSVRPRWFSDNNKGAAAASSSSSSPLPPPAAAALQQPNKKGGFLQWYEGHLQSRPVVTKMVTGSLLWGIGDAVAQLVPQMMTVVGDGGSDDAPTKKAFRYDWPRTGRAAFFGFAIHAPTSHVHFNFLEWLTHRVGVTGLGIPFFKAFMEQFVYWSWLSNSLYHGVMGAMQGMTAQQIYNRIADVLWETQKAQWVSSVCMLVGQAQ